MSTEPCQNPNNEKVISFLIIYDHNVNISLVCYLKTFYHVPLGSIRVVRPICSKSDDKHNIIYILKRILNVINIKDIHHSNDHIYLCINSSDKISTACYWSIKLLHWWSLNSHERRRKKEEESRRVAWKLYFIEYEKLRELNITIDHYIHTL